MRLRKAGAWAGSAAGIRLMDDSDAAGAAIGPGGIAKRLGCQQLLARAADLSPAEPRIRAPMVTAPGPGKSAAVGDG